MLKIRIRNIQSIFRHSKSDPQPAKNHSNMRERERMRWILDLGIGWQNNAPKMIEFMIDEFLTTGSKRHKRKSQNTHTGTNTRSHTHNMFSGKERKRERERWNISMVDIKMVSWQWLVKHFSGQVNTEENGSCHF